MSKAAAGDWESSKFTSLNEAENQLMGAYLAVPEDKRESLVLEITKIATDEIKRFRRSHKDEEK